MSSASLTVGGGAGVDKCMTKLEVINRLSSNENAEKALLTLTAQRFIV
jgi:hypothetical protein